MSDKAYKMWVGAALAFLVFLVNFLPFSGIAGLPHRIYVRSDETAVLKAGLPITATVSSGDGIKVNGESVDSGMVVDLSQPMEISADTEGEAKLDFMVAGLFKIRSMTVKVEDQRKLTPGGQSIGVKFLARGALAVTIDEIETMSGERVNPCEMAGLKKGDVIIAAKGEEIIDSDHLESLIIHKSEPVPITILRGGEEMQLTINPVQDINGNYRLGLWVRDSTKGIGTMSYMDPANGAFGSLGHSITDVSTHDEMLLREGEIAQADVVGIVKGEEGLPGELTGAFLNKKGTIGQIYKNTEFGIFGKMYSELTNPMYPDGLEIGYQDSVHTGPAQILTTIDKSGLRAFDCEIIRVTNQRSPSSKSMILKVTSDELLERTGGIVQGMSGSPIIQDGKLIGAVTHVFVNDPQRGYGIYIEWMLSESDGL